MLTHLRPVSSRALHLLAGVTGLLLLAASAHAQHPGELRPGARVRIRYAGVERPYEGRLVSLSRDSLVLALASPGDPRMAIPREAVARAWVSAGQHRKTLAGLGVGFLAGAAVGAAAGAITYQPCTGDNCFLDFGRGTTAAVSAIFVGTAGLVVGGVAGYFTHGQSWEAVPLPTTAISIMPAGRAVTVGVRARL